MPDIVLPLIGRGELNLGPTDARVFRFEIRATGVTFFLVPSGVSISVFDFAAGANASAARGRVSFVALPASPSDAFPVTALSVQGDQFSLTVALQGPFAGRANFQLRDLNLVFGARKDAARLNVTGSVTATIFQKTMTLTPVFDDAGCLVFRPAQPVDPVTAPIGTLNLSSLELGAQYDRWANLQALYPFSEDGSRTAHDFAGTTHALDVTFTPPSIGISTQVDVIQTGGRLVSDPSKVAIGSTSTPVRSSDAATALLVAGRGSNELTLEAYVRPSLAAQGGPAQIFSLAKDDQNRYFALAHGGVGGQSGSQFQARVRNSEQAVEIALASPAPAATDVPTCLVLTRASSGRADFYVNGTRQATTSSPGNLDWFGNYFLSVANSPGGRQPWAGEIFRVAIYDHAKTESVVRENYHPVVGIRDKGFLRATGLFELGSFVATSSLPVFRGDILLRGETPEAGAASVAFTLSGHVDLFPEWSPVQAGADIAASIDGQGLSNIAQPAAFTLENFHLLRPVLKVGGGSVGLSGQWFGHDLLFTAIERAGEFVLQVKGVQFTLPGTTFGPVTDSVSGSVIVDSVTVDSAQVSLDIELSPAGFFANASVTFQWTDGSGATHTVPVPPFPVFEPPPTRNALTDLVYLHVRDQAGELLGEVLVHGEDYYFMTGQATPVLFHGTSATALPQTIVTSLPRIYSPDLTAALHSTPAVFSLAKTASGYDLTIDVRGSGGALASFTDIRTAYKDFLTKIETAALLPGAVEMLKARIAERLPLPVDQLLFYHYGLDPVRNLIDLVAGMRLRVDYEHYQLVHPSDRAALDGYVGGGTSYYHVSSALAATNSGTPKYTLSFDSFLAGLQSKIDADLSVVGAAGVIDLQQPAFRKRYFRLIYPGQFSGPGARGFTGTERVATVIGSDTLASLETASIPPVSTDSVAASDSTVAFFFRGRATVIPEISVFVDEHPVYVAVGTSVRHILQRFGGIPTAGLGSQDLSAYRGRLRPMRLVHDGANSTATYKFIDFSQYAAFGITDIFDVPAVMGDRYFL